MTGLFSAISTTSFIGASSSVLASAAMPGSTRYHLPRTGYFESRRGMPLHTLAGYAEAERLVGLVGTNLGTRMFVPFRPPLEYSPYGAGVVERIRERPDLASELTGRWDRAIVVSPGTAILGLGEAPRNKTGLILAEAGMPIMAGKAKFFLQSAGVNTVAQCLHAHITEGQYQQLERMKAEARKTKDADKLWQAEDLERRWRAEKFAEIVIALACNYGFINIEDAQGKDLPIILGALECLKGQCAVWSDDMQGTGVITAAGVLAWADQTDRDVTQIRVILMGAGAGSMGVYNELLNHGVKAENILVTDSRGVLHEGRRDVDGDPFKEKLRMGIDAGTTVEAFAKGADALINLGVPESLTDDLVWTRRITESLAKNPLFAPMTNPEPGITPDMLRGVREDAFYASGNQQYVNPFNNFTAFGQIGAGSLIAKAGGVGAGMTVAAAHGILEVAKLGAPEWLRDRLPKEQRQYGRHWLVPHPLDIRLIAHEAGAVAKAAAREGLATGFVDNPTKADYEAFDAKVDRQVRLRTRHVRTMRDKAAEEGRNYLQENYEDRYAPFTLPGRQQSVYDVAPEIPFDEFERHARAMGVKEERWQQFLNGDGELKGNALTEILNLLVTKMKKDAKEFAGVERDWERELEIIVQIAQIYPALGMALALRRSRVRNYETTGSTVFHRERVIHVVMREVREARKSIYEFAGVPDTP